MIAARQFTNFSASLNPFNSIPHVQPTATPPLDPAISFAGSLIPPASILSVPLPSSINNGIPPSQVSVLPWSVGAFTPSFTETIVYGTGSPIAAVGSSFEPFVQPTAIITSDRPLPSGLFVISGSQSDVTTQISGQPSVASWPLVTTKIASFTAVSPTTSSSTSESSPSTSSSSSSFSYSSSSSSKTSSTSSMTSVRLGNITMAPSNTPTPFKGTLGTGAIAGIAFGSAALLAIFAFLFFLYLRSRKSNKPPSIYPEEAYLYDPPITPPSNPVQATQPIQPWMSENTAYQPVTQLPPGGGPMIPNSPPMIPSSPPMRAVTPEGYERVALLDGSEVEQDMAMLRPWPSLRRGNSASYRPLGTGRGYKLPPVHEDLQEAVDNDPRNPFRDQNVL